jgi:hypothetical protein
MAVRLQGTCSSTISYIVLVDLLVIFAHIAQARVGEENFQYLNLGSGYTVDKY